jgi:general secretion pathway protein G
MMRGMIMKNKKSTRIRNKGFTLIEILIVVAIIGLIASMIAPNLIGQFQKSKEEIAKAQIETLSAGAQSYLLDVGRLPANLGELITSTDPKWRGPYLSKNRLPQDPWNRDYQYKAPGDHGAFDLYSLGPNGKLDDKAIVNW